MMMILKNLKLILFFAALLITTVGFGQKVKITGKVTEANKAGIPGASIVVVGTTVGTVSDINGNYSLEVTPPATLSFSFVGFKPFLAVVEKQTVINVQLEEETVGVNEVVVIGYGTARKKDATGSVQAVSTADFNRGAITSPQQLVSGKIAGVQITNGGGAPGEGATIRIRGGSSLSASNDPLIVIDGVPVDNDGISGMRNPLSTIHPTDIETFTVLKDASATAIYGSRASNGVILITTKTGKKGAKMKVNYNGFVSVSNKTQSVDVLSANEFTDLIKKRYAGNANALALLGKSNTIWQDEIYQTAISHDHNVSLTGNVSLVPYRVSLGYSNEEGILLTDGLSRFTGALSLNPSFLKDHLRVNLNLKGMMIDNQFANRGAVGTAVHFDPTQPVYNGNAKYGNFFTWVQPNGNPIDIAPMNPVAQLLLNDDQAKVNRFLGNLQIDYRFHFLPDLRANLNVGYDRSSSDGTTIHPITYSANFDARGGRNNVYTQDKKNELLDFYLNYTKDIGGISSRVDAMAGYSWQHFKREGTFLEKDFAKNYTYQNTDYKTESYLVSFFGRINWITKDRYMATFTLRDDGSSRFSPDTRWGLFPSLALAWRIKEEGFLKNSNVVSELKLRLGYGITGQQNISNNDYPYLARYTQGEVNAQYLFGTTWYPTFRAEGYDANIKWEETVTYNIGLDYGFAKDRITGTIDLYQRKTNDLINFIPVPAGTNLSNYLLTNVGNLENKGVEFSVNAIPVKTSDFTWDIGFNASYNKNKILKLRATDDPTYPGVETGGIDGGVGNNIQIHSVGYPMNSFYVYEQVYNSDGKPLENVFVDRNGDGNITKDDRYRFHKAAPDVIMGVTTKLTWKNWDFYASGRSYIGNYMYNNVWSGGATYSNLYQSVGFLNNLNKNVFSTGFENPRYFSDYYVTNASFFKVDNMALGYTFSNLLKEKMHVRVYASMQNVATISKYEGLDPEINGGVDNNLYPRPRTFVFGMNIDF
jgi:TonB-linked SusC/RagA family outer membrane protein